VKAVPRGERRSVLGGTDGVQDVSKELLDGGGGAVFLAPMVELGEKCRPFSLCRNRRAPWDVEVILGLAA